MATSTRQHSPTQYSVLRPAPGQAAFHKLVDACREAVEEYDKSNDHVPHDRGADCVRCNLAAVLWASGAPSPSARKTARLRETADRVLRDSVELFPEMASGVRSFDERELGLAIEHVLSVFPGMTVTVGKAADAVRRAESITRELNRISDEAKEYADLVNRHLSAVGDAESCARIMHQAH